MTLLQKAGWGAAIFVAGVGAGKLVEDARWLGYRSYDDCVIHEVKEARGNAEMLAPAIARICRRQTAENSASQK